MIRQMAATLNKFEWLILLLLLGLLLFPTPIRGLLLLVVPLLWLVRWLATRQFVPPTPLNTIVFLLLLMVGVSLVATFDINLSFPKIAGMVMGIALFYGAINVMRLYRLGGWFVLAFVIAAGTGLALVGAVGTYWQPPFGFLNVLETAVPAPYRTIPETSGTVNLNELAGVLDWIVPLLLVLLAASWRHWPLWLRLPLLGVTGLLGGLLVATLSRGGIAACGLALLVVLAVRFRWGRWLLLEVAIAATIVFFYYNLDDLILASSQSADPLALAGRLEIWSRALYGIADFPFTGMSMNGFRRVVHILYPLFLIPPDTDIGHAHNHLLQAALDLGIPGLIAYLAIWVTSAALLWQSWRTAADKMTRFVALGLMGSLAAGWLFGMLDAIALGARPGFIWWLLLALVVGVHDAMREKRPFLPLGQPSKSG
ncbi:MAG: O-antigen ligase family protein [Chloroflexota bacterium]